MSNGVRLDGPNYNSQNKKACAHSDGSALFLIAWAKRFGCFETGIPK